MIIREIGLCNEYMNALPHVCILSNNGFWQPPVGKQFFNFSVDKGISEIFTIWIRLFKGFNPGTRTSSADSHERNLSASKVNPARIALTSLQNFQDYLRYKEHSSENLLFWNWYKSYRQRFDSLPLQERSLSPIPPETPSLDSGKRIPRIKISGTDRTTGGGFSLSAEVTIVISFSSCWSEIIWRRGISPYWTPLGPLFNHPDPRLISLFRVF